MASASYIDLKQRLREVRRHMLPSKFSPTGVYSDAQRERARGYTLLAHAEIESYLEAVVEAYIQRRRTEWHAIAASTTTGRIQIASTTIEVKRMQNLVDAMTATTRNLILRNNGVKGDNIRRLLDPLGVDVRSALPTLMANLTSFGDGRGAFAHAGGFVARIDPRSELSTVQGLLPDLLKLDKLLGR